MIILVFVHLNKYINHIYKGAQTHLLKNAIDKLIYERYF